MAETKTDKLEREYIIPLRSEWLKVADYRRAGRAVKAIKKFIAKHMKVQDRDVSKVKLDTYLNQEVWFKGRRKPPAKLKVRAVKEGEIVKVYLAEEPANVKFLKAKQEKRHKPTDKPAVAPKEEKKEEKTEEKKKEESEKEKSVAEARATETKLDVKAQKHLSKVKEESHHRMALQK
jgi:large subunit ribosomal protein L31e